MTTAEQIYELVKAMPEAQANMVLMFAELVGRRDSGASEAEAVGKDDEAWRSLIQELSGTWPDFPMAEALRATAGQDVAREPL